MKYKVKKTVEKFLWASVLVVIAGIASVYGNSPYYLALVPIFEAIKNYVKHRKD